MTNLLTGHYAVGVRSLLDLRYNIHILQKPSFEVPNPIILSSILRYVSNNVVSADADGSPHFDKAQTHNFKRQYIAYIQADVGDFQEQVEAMCAIVIEFFDMYEAKCTNMWCTNQVLPASTYIQNNQTELPAMAYHGNLVIEKAKGGSEVVRCVGHLGNSFPGCACIREGKGMLNTFQSMPTAVHVM